MVEKSSDGRGNASAFSFNRSHIFLNERPFATRLQSCFSERAVCPLASDISYRQAGEGEKERTNEKQHIDNLLSPFFPHLPFLPIMEPLSLYAPSLFEAVSAFISVSVIHPSILSI